MVDEAVVHDNSSTKAPYRRVYEHRRGRRVHAAADPAWFAPELSDAGR